MLDSSEHPDAEGVRAKLLGVSRPVESAGCG
jgi:hypothetical protein